MMNTVLNDDEKIILIARKHWFVLAVEFAVIFFVLILPFALFFFLGALNIFSFSKNLTPIFVMAGSLWTLFVWMLFFFAWTDYYLDIWIITDKRLIDIEQRGLFNRNVATLRLERIQDSNVEIKGIIATILKFGNINVQTAAGSPQFFMRHIKNPYEVKDTILKYHHAALEEERYVKIKS